MDLLRSLPIGLYLDQPITRLHQLDARVKFIWLMAFLAAPLLANPWWRLALVGLLMFLTLLAPIPPRVWRQQMGWLIFLAIIVFLITAITPDGLAVSIQPRLPEEGLNLPPASDYQYVLWDRGRLFVTRRSLELAVRISTLVFTLIYSTNLFLLTTAPEEITEGLENLISPLRRFNVPVTEISLTLTLSLRFIPLVLEEVQNLARAVRTRAINWQKLGIKRSLNVWLTVVEKLLDNLLLRAEQIAIAMEVRGFTSPNQHQVRWHQLQLRWADFIALFLLIPFWAARLVWGGLQQLSVISYQMGVLSVHKQKFPAVFSLITDYCLPITDYCSQQKTPHSLHPAQTLTSLSPFQGADVDGNVVEFITEEPFAPPGGVVIRVC